MASLSYNTYYFTNVKKWTIDENNDYSYKGVLVASKLNQRNGQDYKLLDAIDIDWNGAWLPSIQSYIYNTEDLIKALDLLNTNDTVEGLLLKLSELERILSEVVISYVSHERLSYVLEGYQQKLEAGTNIIIDSYNNISTYNVITLDDIQDYVSKEELYSYYYNKIETEEVAAYAAAYAVSQVIDEADEAFDTLKEIADWILEQDKYVLVEDLEELERIKEAAINGEEHDKLYVRGPKGGFVEVEDYTTIDTSGETEYYKRESLLLDFKELQDRFNILEETVGYKEIVEGITTYTGMRSQIEHLRENLEVTTNIANLALEYSEQAIVTANEAYAMGYMAYNTANIAYDTANIAYDTSNIAYTVAVKASYDVGVPSEEEEYILANAYYVIDVLEHYAENQILPNPSLYTYNGELYHELTEWDYSNYLIYDTAYNKYYILDSIKEEIYNEETLFYIHKEAVEGTGLTRRVEIVEERMDDLEDALADNNALLYELKVDNSYSDYVKLGFLEDEYTGNKSRTITIQHDTAYIDTYTGEILHDGIADIQTISNCFTYATSWLTLPCDDPENHVMPSLEDKISSIKNGYPVYNYFVPKFKIYDNEHNELSNIEISVNYNEYRQSFDAYITNNYEAEIQYIISEDWIEDLFIDINNVRYNAVTNKDLPIIDGDTTLLIFFKENHTGFSREGKITVNIINKLSEKIISSFTIKLTQNFE